MLKIGLAQTDITPRRPVCLAGYFNKRISKGIFDKLYAKVVVLEKDNFTLGIITLDLIGLSYEDVEKIKSRLNKHFSIPPDHLLISCTHTHTGPATSSLFAVNKDRQFIKELIPLIEDAFSKALKNKKETDIYIAEIREGALSFNRRYIMKDGTVITNAPKRDPRVNKPEGPVDNLITTLAFISKSKITGLLVNATNHCDTIGGNKISADWPGHLTRELNKKLKGKFPVLVLTGTAGNINHFNPDMLRGQISYNESRRIGKAYSLYILKSLRKKKLLRSTSLSCLSEKLTIPYRKVANSEIKRAKKLLKLKVSKPSKDLTSLDLAQGSIAVKKLFARALLDFVRLCQTRQKGVVDITAFKIGSLALVGIPGEPFVEIGLAVKNSKLFPHIIVTGNTNGQAGYIPLRRHFKKGGYETCTHSYNRFSKDLGEKTIKKALGILKIFL